jgi:phage repressor protein C with HTH and peptisase S24 domain
LAPASTGFKKSDASGVFGGKSTTSEQVSGLRKPSHAAHLDRNLGPLLVAQDAALDQQTAARGPPDEIVHVKRFYVMGSAGRGRVLFGDPVVEYLPLSTAFIRNVLRVRPEDLVILAVDGTSMEPTLSHGEVVLVDRGVERVRDSDVYVLLLHDELFIKRLQRRHDGGVVMRSDNRTYEPEHLSPEQAESLHVLGRVLTWKFGRFVL